MVGLLIGLAITSGFAFWDSSLHSHLQPIGVFLFCDGWVILMGSVFGVGMDKFIDLPPPTKCQKWICRSSIVVGIALTTIAWVVYAKPPETGKENKALHEIPVPHLDGILMITPPSTSKLTPSLGQV